MSAKINTLLTLVLLTGALCGQNVLVDGVQHQAGYQGLPVPTLDVRQDNQNYLVSFRNGLAGGVVFLLVSDTAGTWSQDLGAWGAIDLELVNPSVADLGVADVFGSLTCAVGKPAALPPFLDGATMQVGVLQTAYSVTAGPVYHTYALSTRVQTFVLTAAVL